MKKLNENPIIILIPVIAAICAIIYFCTNENLPGIISKIFNGDTSPETPIDDLNEPENYPDEPEDDKPENDKPEEYFLDATFCHFPDIEKGDFILGGTWKLQGIHEDATSFSQSISVWFDGNPQLMCYGHAQYGTVWAEDALGNWEETLEEFDELAHYDYPKGTYGTFVIDMTDMETIPFGEYTCELTVVINQVIYTKQLPFSLEG